MTHLSLFSGIGGLDLAAEWAGFTTIGQCEWADYPSKVLEKHWPDVPRWRDVRELTAQSFKEKTGIESPTVVSGGFPCQPHSLAGQRLASNDERDLWSELCRVYRETGARWLVAENVQGLLTSENGRFFGRILRDLAQGGGIAWWYCFLAYAAGAKYVGERVAIVATTDRVGWGGMAQDREIRPDEKHQEHLEAWETRQNDILPYPERTFADPSGGIERNDDGIPGGLDELKAYGNAVNPHQFYPIFRAIKEVEEEQHGMDQR